jgi:hypothetical protein
MVLSSGRGKGWWVCGVGAFFVEQCPEDVDAAACQGDGRLSVGASVVAFLLVVVAVWAFAHHAGLRRLVEHMAQRRL